MKILILPVLITAIATFALAQGQPCSLTVEKSPTIRGLHLGMSSAEVLKLFPGSSRDSKVQAEIAAAGRQYGRSRFYISVGRFPATKGFSDVPLIEFVFIDDRLSLFELQYTGVEWHSYDEFLTKVSEVLLLPGPKDWRTDGPNRLLECQGFELRAFRPGQSGMNLTVRDTSAEQLVKNREADAKEKARRDFKP